MLNKNDPLSRCPGVKGSIGKTRRCDVFYTDSWRNMVRNREEQKERGGKKESQNQPLHQENKALFMRKITVWVQEYFWRHTEKKSTAIHFCLVCPVNKQLCGATSSFITVATCNRFTVPYFLSHAKGKMCLIGKINMCDTASNSSSRVLGLTTE